MQPISEQSANILQTKELSRHFGELVAVNALNINVQKNSIFGLLGPNGAGKSTLIKMLTTLLDPTSGEAFIDLKFYSYTYYETLKIIWVPLEIIMPTA